MNARSLFVAGVAAGAILSLATAPVAQTRGGAARAAAPAASQAPLTFGAPIPGLCVYSEGQIFGQSKVGQAVSARMRMLANEVNAELQPEAQAIQTERNTLQSSASTLDQNTLGQRAQALQTRYESFEKRAAQRNEELKETQSKQIQEMERQLQPVLTQLFQQNRCSILLEREQAGVAAVNPAMDFSGQAVAGLDGRIQTLTFDRVHLDAQPSAQPAAAR
jgi:Skp family chaperone for outer membrane proteins